MKDFFDDLRQMSQIERTRMLEANADEVKAGHYYRTFSEEEVAELKELNTENDLEIRSLEAEKARLVEPINKRLTELKNTKKHTLTNIVEGRESVTGDYYIFHDEDDRKTYHLSPLGEIIWEGHYTGYQKTITGEIFKARIANG